MNISLLLRLFAAHLIADFFLQTKKSCDNKKELRTSKGWHSQLLHALIQATSAYVFAGLWTCWQIPIVIFITHLIIDVAKYSLGKGGLLSFFLDQIVHISVIAGLYFLLGGVFEIIPIFETQFWAIVLSYLIILTPTSVFITAFYQNWSKSRAFSSKDALKETLDYTADTEDDFYKGGTYIGYLERILALTFIFAGCWEGVGFLLAAKSIFRFGDLQNKKDVSRTEYVLVGTFLSFSVPVVIGLIVSKLFTF